MRTLSLLGINKVRGDVGVVERERGAANAIQTLYCTVFLYAWHGSPRLCVVVLYENVVLYVFYSLLIRTFTLSDLRCRCADAKNNERFKSFNHACTSRLIINHAQFARLSQILVSIFDFDTPWRRTVSQRDWFAEKG